MSAIDLTLVAIDAHRWTVVLLGHGTKRLPDGSTWARQSTRNLDRIRKHLLTNAGIGLDVAASGVVVLDFDRSALKMFAALGTIPPTATSPSGGTHSYFAFTPNLPAKIEWEGERIGEILRGAHQQVVMPPSPYPGNEKRKIPAGGFYEWCCNPCDPLPDLPTSWIAHFTGASIPVAASVRPDFIPSGQKGVPQWLIDEVSKSTEWDGPPAEEIIRRAMLFLIGAERRLRGVKAQCPQCATDGHDRHRDNAFIRNDGVWGCAFAPGDVNHRRAIAKALGILR
jgi:hypothetical protein